MDQLLEIKIQIQQPLMKTNLKIKLAQYCQDIKFQKE